MNDEQRHKLNNVAFTLLCLAPGSLLAAHESMVAPLDFAVRVCMAYLVWSLARD